eukprot:TRINITY_DN8204_c0_g3_i1.p1 TRINITY_DN8204_c0_g3~~TRINITY_DN8204_c0_g3_i1.p1  ORF type:complete len:153 (-),score=7.39 TRINITY_DN8204_c0_g3_i1:364-822(-)
MQNQKNNTKSLPHAMAYLILHPNASGMLPIVLGSDWQSWAQSTFIRGQKLTEIIKEQPIWQCAKEELEEVHIPQELYSEIYIQEYLEQYSDSDNIIDQIRVVILNRIIVQLVGSSLLVVGQRNSIDISPQQQCLESVPLMEQCVVSDSMTGQ